MSESGFNGRKRESEPYEIGHTVAPRWGIVNMQMYVDGAFDCFVKEVPVNDDDSGYMTYECGYDDGYRAAMKAMGRKRSRRGEAE